MTVSGRGLRTQPRQDRARATVARIKTAALELIREAGVERFTTNHVADRAGVNISTLYRYFPDKSHLLHALMKDFESDRVAFFVGHLPALTQRESWPVWVAEVVEGLARIRRQQVGGVAIRRVISAFPELHALDRQSSDQTAAELARALRTVSPDLDEQVAGAMASVVIANLTHLLDMAFEQDDHGDPLILREAVRVLSSYTP
ncbi:TetR/AcrR family transcriptional regulator [Ornithinimicrobium cavernae]|uniref:TetR/AcrR family transcriptional regulator n=1 Tax=Ornithinimicrobium cavernae TaxID=2666047 RepID=UPI000D6987AB|nr:TetR/AcrR family transcriptional regulator [Ornithinimicrobium cavernae]